MGQPQTGHPDQQLLADFGLGKLDPNEASEIESHLMECETCNDTLLNLKDDTFAGMVRTADVPSELAATDGDFSGVSADTAQTLLVQSGDPVDEAELPFELRTHPRYRIVELIGRGGMGDVYRAEHKLMNRSVALKLINSRLINHPHAVDRFRREVQAAAQLAHPNIVTAYDAEQAGDVHFLVMEYVEGTDLASLVKQRGPFSVSDACELIRQAAEGLQHAHERGMVHRDIKPHNLMISGASGRAVVKILDFGLAGFATEAALYEADVTAEEAGGESVPLHLTTIGSVMGTPDYISPEQAKDAHAADIRADIYSLGCTLCFLLTGEPPFQGDSVVEKLKAHIEEPPPAIEKTRDDVPVELVEIVHKMLAKDPDERYQTPAEVAQALEPWAKRQAEPVRVTSDKRKWTIAAAIALPLMLLAGVIVYLATDTGKIEISNLAGDVGRAKIVLLKEGKEYATFDLEPGTKGAKIRAGEYEVRLKGAPADVKMNVWSKKGNASKWGEPDDHENETIVVYRGGGLMIEVSKTSKGKPPTPPEYHKSFKAIDPIITKNGVTQEADGWKITATDTRTVRLFEVTDPNFAAGQVTYRAKLKTENVKGRAYLEMRLRFPGQGEFFSKGFHNAVSGTTDWAEYEIPFLLEEGQVPDLAKLNLTIEGSGTVWIKDVELLWKPSAAESGETVIEVDGQKRASATLAAKKWFELVAADKYDEIWESLAPFAKQQVTKEQLKEVYSKNRDDLGQPLARTLRSVLSGFKVPGIPAGEYIAVLFETRFSKKGPHQEQVVLVWDKDDWRVVGYHFAPSQAQAEEAVKPGVNLITDPSLENTAVGENPKVWGGGNIQPRKTSYRHAVAAEARTGKHGWLIEGDGEFASIPTDRPLVDRAFRYGGRCWVKLEGGTAVLGILYFDKNGAYIPGATTNIQSVNQNGWHEMHIADDLANVPGAHRLSLTLTLRGKGKAVFDDLEFIAFDKNNLPKDFEEKYASKPKPDPELFDRWVGRWETTAEYKPTAGNPGRTVKGKSEARKILDGEFLLMQWAAETGDEEYLSLWAWNEYLNAYQMWIFGSGGEAYERVGHWDKPSQTLRLNVKPPVPASEPPRFGSGRPQPIVTGFSTDRFVDNNRIESTLLVKSPKGEVTIDLNMTSISPRDQKALSDKLRLSERRADAPRELSKLEQFAGKWKLESTLKPSVSLPEGKTETVTEHADWAIGGRYLLMRSYGEDEKLQSLGLMTWVPGKNVYRYWHFAKGVYGGQWEITENLSGTGFNWKAADMPTGWIGTGYNRQIDPDTFETAASIKDDKGQVRLDAQMKKTRLK